jgi:hypothetical protein
LQQGREIVIRDRVFVLLAQEPLLDERIDAGWERVGVPALEEPDSAGVLFAAKDELFFLLALRHLLPCRHDDCEEHGHDAHGDQKGRHCVTRLSAAATAVRSFLTR